MRHIMAISCLSAFLFIGACFSPSRAAEAAPKAPSKEGIEFFEKNIRPVLAESCYKCHSVEAKANKKLKSGFYADSMEGLTKGGSSGNPGIVPGDVEKSTVLKSIHYSYKDDDESLNMPPEKAGGKLPDDVIKHFDEWVKMGAPAPTDFQKPKEPKADAGSGQNPQANAHADPAQHWAFKAPVAAAPPALKDGAWVKNDVDRFVLARLEAKGLRPTAQLDRPALLRRVTFDLIGLPPTPEEIAAFVADRSPDAYEKVVDRLLASPRYGERWGRHWLDVARYSDTKGYVFNEERRYPYAYTYRDYVIDAFNSDKPYDRFLIEQIAADKLDLKGDPKPLAAMGFLTVGRRFLNNPHDIIDDRIDVVARGTMGLTVACARCHDHKYDPIPTRDYYSLHGIFDSSMEPKELPLLGGKGTPAFEAELAKRQAVAEEYGRTEVERMLTDLRKPEQLALYIVSASPNAQDAAKEAVGDRELNRGMLQRWKQKISQGYGAKEPVFAAWREYAHLKPDEFAAKSAAVTDRIAKDATPPNKLVQKAFAGNPPKSFFEVCQRYAAFLADHDKAEKYADADAESIRQLMRGDDSPLVVALRDRPSLMDRKQRQKLKDLESKVVAWQAESPDAPPRAMVLNDVANPHNSTILIRGNPNNRGAEVPRHFLQILSKPDAKPYSQGSGRLELAQSIANRDNPLTARVFVNRVWAWHFGKGIVTTPSDFGVRSDPPSHPELLDFLAVRFMDQGWSIKKLQREIVLSATYQQGSADNAAARGIDPENRLLWRQNRQRLDFEEVRDSLLAVSEQLNNEMGGRPVDVSVPEDSRRTVYAFIDRQNLPSMFRSFDFASPDTTNAQRFSTTVPQQALFFLNSPFVQRQASLIFDRPDLKQVQQPADRIARLYQVLFSRQPTPGEVEMAKSFIANEEATESKETAAAGPAWAYGSGKLDPATQRVVDFSVLPHRDKLGWHGGAKVPDPKLGWVLLSAEGGHTDRERSAIRRLIAPAAGTLSISGRLQHTFDNGDGVRGVIVSSRAGVLGQWHVRNSSADTNLPEVKVEAGETIDFVVEAGPTDAFDGFAWAPKLRLVGPSVAGGSAEFDANADFSTGNVKQTPPQRLTPWARLAQVLMASNEYMFVE